jgi:hypothetical protein
MRPEIICKFAYIELFVEQSAQASHRKHRWFIGRRRAANIDTCKKDALIF